MPTVQIHMFKRTLPRKRALVRAVTDAIVKTLKIPHDWVDIIIHEISREQSAVGGILVSDKKKKTKSNRKE